MDKGSQAMKWKSVKDELPELDGPTAEYVLIYDEVKGIMVGYLSFLMSESYWTIKDDRTAIEKEPLNITHWQPLPEKPKDK